MLVIPQTLLSQYENSKPPRKGLSIITSANESSIYTDPFRSLPAYLFNYEGQTTLCADPLELLRLIRGLKLEIDTVAFHETLLYGTPLHDRTIFTEVRQIPAGSVARYSHQRGTYTIDRWFNYNIEKSLSISSIADAADSLKQSALAEIRRIPHDRPLIMGLSGGLDSRLTAALLKAGNYHHNLELFTFGFDKTIYEYTSAKAIAAALGLCEPIFHRLEYKHYSEALEYLPEISFGHVAINHCHIASYLECVKPGFLHISNYFSDALFGYATRKSRTRPKQGDDQYSRRAINSPLIPRCVKDAILEDIKILLRDFDKDSNYSSPEEFIYVTERNPKFHFNMASCQARFCETICPYASLNLFELMMAIPIEYRENKVILDELFNRHFPEIASSSVFEISSRLSRRFVGASRWAHFRMLNAINGVLTRLTNGRFQCVNRYQTEEQSRILSRHFRRSIDLAIDHFADRRVIPACQIAKWKRIPTRARRTSELFSIISLHQLMKSQAASVETSLL
jgi:hypothetical protein